MLRSKSGFTRAAMTPVAGGQGRHGLGVDLDEGAAVQGRKEGSAVEDGTQRHMAWKGLRGGGVVLHGTAGPCGGGTTWA